MPNHSNRRLSAETLAADRIVVTALQNIPKYAPSNAAYTRDVLDAKSKLLETARVAEFHAQNALAAARDAAVAAEWEFHQVVLGVKDQVVAQFGVDSNEVQALGLKKKSERKRVPGRPRVSAEG